MITGEEARRHPDFSRHWDGADGGPLMLECTRPGVFAIGDVRAGSTKRVAAAVGMGRWSSARSTSRSTAANLSARSAAVRVHVRMHVRSAQESVVEVRTRAYGRCRPNQRISTTGPIPPPETGLEGGEMYTSMRTRTIVALVVVGAMVPAGTAIAGPGPSINGLVGSQQSTGQDGSGAQSSVNALVGADSEQSPSQPANATRSTRSSARTLSRARASPRTRARSTHWSARSRSRARASPRPRAPTTPRSARSSAIRRRRRRPPRWPRRPTMASTGPTLCSGPWPRSA